MRVKNKKKFTVNLKTFSLRLEKTDFFYLKPLAVELFSLSLREYGIARKQFENDHLERSGSTKI